MIEIDNIKVFNLEGAIRGMRNPFNSWAKSDSFVCVDGTKGEGLSAHCPRNPKDEEPFFCVGDADMALMRNLYEGGTAHRKFMRQILVSMDINAPLYWWKEFDTYKVGTVANSCSTMHTIHKKPFRKSDFSFEELMLDYKGLAERIVKMLNEARAAYLETKNKKFWWQIIQLLPSSYNQRRTITCNYENLAAIVELRSGHKLGEWRMFCTEVLKNCEYLLEIMGRKAGDE